MLKLALLTTLLDLLELIMMDSGCIGKQNCLMATELSLHSLLQLQWRLSQLPSLQKKTISRDATVTLTKMYRNYDAYFKRKSVVVADVS